MRTKNILAVARRSTDMAAPPPVTPKDRRCHSPFDTISDGQGGKVSAWCPVCNRRAMHVTRHLTVECYYGCTNKSR